MSADNWATCPACYDAAKKKYEADAITVDDTYGKVPIAEFDAAREALITPDPEDFITFREDYEFSGAEQGTIYANYSGGCTECGLSAYFEYDHNFWP